MTEQRIFRGRHKSNFSALSNKIWEDKKLSVEAKGTLGYLLSRPPNWHVRLPHLGRELNVGKERLQRIFRELIAAGYVARRQGRKRGAFAPLCYSVRDEPVPSVATLPQPEKPEPAKPEPGNQAAYKRRNSINTDSKKNHINKPLPQTPCPIAPSAPAARGPANERKARPDHESVVQARVAERLGHGNVELGWSILQALTDRERESLTIQERCGRLTDNAITEMALNLKARLSKAANAA